jgi:hypothetical protein
MGPIVGHASDGDNHRFLVNVNKLYHITRFAFEIKWLGWLMFAGLNEAQDAWGFHDQDYIHNGKKLINPLDSSMSSLQLGVETCFLEHIGLVYNKYTFDQHGR